MRPSRPRVTSTSARSSSRSPERREPPLGARSSSARRTRALGSSSSALGAAPRRVPHLVLGERLGLADELLDVVRVALQARRDLGARVALREEALALLDAGEMSGERADEPRRAAARR